MQECPVCKLINPDESITCDCGYNFKTRSKGSSSDPVQPASSVNRWPLYLIPFIMFVVGRVFSEQFGPKKGDLDIPMFVLGAFVTTVFFVPAIIATLLRHRYAIAVFLANFAGCILLGFERFVLASLAWLAIISWSLLPFVQSRIGKNDKAV